MIYLGTDVIIIISPIVKVVYFNSNDRDLGVIGFQVNRILKWPKQTTNQTNKKTPSNEVLHENDDAEVNIKCIK